MDEFGTEKKSYRVIWIAAAAVAVFLVVLGGAIYLVLQTGPKTPIASTTTDGAQDSAVPTKEQVQDNIDKATASLKQAASDQATAKAAAGDSKNQIKVGI